MMQTVQAALGDPYLRKEVIEQMVELKKKKRLMNLMLLPQSSVHQPAHVDDGMLANLDTFKFREVINEWRKKVPMRNQSLEKNELMRRALRFNEI